MLLFALLLACTDKQPPAVGDDGGADAPAPAPARAAEPAAWQAPGSLDTTTFPWAPQAGDPSQDSVILSVRTDRDQVTGVVMADDGAGGWVEVARPTLTRGEGELVARATLTGLAADTVHAWAAYDGELRSSVGRFRTATGEGAFRQLTLTATSCLGGNEPIPNMRHAAARAPDLALLLGDTVYADDATTLEAYRAYWDETMRWQGMADWVGGAGVVAAWDDHEVTNNYVVSELEPGRFDVALQAFRESLPQTQGPTSGVWRRQSWGSILDLYVLDVRAERDPATGHYIGPEQEAWLLDGLTTSQATFKLVVTSVPITDYEDFLAFAAADDRWQGWPEQRERILERLEAAGIRGLLWLGGDVHFATVSTVGIPGGDGPAQAMWEVLAGPAGRSPNVAADLYEHDGSHYQFMFSTFNSLVLTLDPGRVEVHVEYLGDDGSVLGQTTLAL